MNHSLLSLSPCLFLLESEQINVAVNVSIDTPTNTTRKRERKRNLSSTKHSLETNPSTVTLWKWRETIGFNLLVKCPNRKRFAWKNRFKRQRCCHSKNSRGRVKDRKEKSFSSFTIVNLKLITVSLLPFFASSLDIEGHCSGEKCDARRRRMSFVLSFVYWSTKCAHKQNTQKRWWRACTKKYLFNVSRWSRVEKVTVCFQTHCQRKKFRLNQTRMLDH